MNSLTDSNRLVAVGITFVASACCCTIPTTHSAADKLAMIAEEYGHATVSTPILSRPDERFEFDLNRPALTYFEEAKSEVQGGAAYFEQVVQSLQAGLSVQADPTQAAAYSEALQQYYRSKQYSDEHQRLREEAADTKVALAEERVLRAKEERERAQAELSTAPDDANLTELQSKLNDAETALRAAEDELVAAKVEQAESRSFGEGKPDYPTASSEDNTPDPAEGVAKAPEDARGVLSQEKFQGFGGLLGDISPTVNNRTAIISAAGDKAVEAIFRVLGKPEQAQKFHGQTILFGIAMVSVNPGWRTMTGFAADISVQVEMGLQPARPETLTRYLNDSEIPAPLRRTLVGSNGLLEVPNEVLAANSASKIPQEWGGANRLPLFKGPRGGAGTVPVPLVAAVSPMTETETLDLGASFRSREELSLRLALALRSAGLAAQAEVFEQFVKDQQRDIKTRNAIAAVSSYSAGHIFGYQIGPRLLALGDPTAKNSDAAYHLSRQAFPVLLIVGLDDATARPQLIPTASRGSNSNAAGKPDVEPAAAVAASTKGAAGGAASPKSEASALLAEPYIKFTQSTHWVPLSRTAACDRLSPDQLFRLSDRLKSPCVLRGALRKHRVDILKNKVFGSFSALPVPLDAMFTAPTPRVLEVVPSTVSMSQKDSNNLPKSSELTITGEELQQIRLDGVKVVTGDAVLAGQPRLVGGAIKVDVIVASTREPLIFLLPTNDRTSVFYTPPVSVSANAPRALVGVVQPAKIMLASDGGGSDESKVDLLLHGENLSRVDLGTVEVSQGQHIATIDGQPSHDSGSIRVTLKVTGPGIFALRMALKNSGAPPQLISSPHVVVEKAPD